MSASTDRGWARAGLGLIWAVVMLVSLAATTFGGMVAGAWLGFDVAPHYDGGHAVSWLLLIGAIAGLAAGLTIRHRGRAWVQTWRLHRMHRRDTVTATATVRQATPKVIRNPRGGSVTVYWVRVRWRGHRRRRPGPAAPIQVLRARRPSLRGTGAPGRPGPGRLPGDPPEPLRHRRPLRPTMADQFI